MSGPFRYPGAKPFEQEQREQFFGREEDTRLLVRMVKLSPLSVLYSKSGLGKSSLLNAGVMPALEEEGYNCLRIRFNAYQVQSSPVESSVGHLANVQPDTTALAPLLEKDHSIWRLTKEYQMTQAASRGLVLIFDQFEELFTYPEEAIRAFRKQLAEALYTAVPQRYWDQLETQQANGQQVLPAEQLRLLQEEPQLKVVLAIRSDRLHLLERLSDYLPLILKNLYELHPLDERSAKAAITEPAFLKGDFSTPRFTYAAAALAQVIGYLTDEGQDHIESTQLQIVCHHLEQRIASTEAYEVVEADVEALEAVIENYYDERIERIEGAAQQYAARRLIEEGLVFEEEERRLSIYEGQALKRFGLSMDTLRLLVDSHLLRAEPGLRGGYTYELSHDTLVKPVLQAKVERLAHEQAAREETARKEREQERALERKKRQRAYLLAIVGLALAAIAIIAAIWAVRQGRIAEQARIEVSQNAYELQWAVATTLKVEGAYEEAISSLERANSYLEQEDTQEQQRLADTLQAWSAVREYMQEVSVLQERNELGQALELLSAALRTSGDQLLETQYRNLLVEREELYYKYLEEARGLLNTNRASELEATLQKMIALQFKDEAELRAELR